MRRRTLFVALAALSLIVVIGALLAIPAVRDELSWRWAKFGNRVDSYSTYVRSWPAGRHSSAARKALEQLTWASAAAGNTIQSVSAYLKSYPQGAHAAEAQTRIDHLKWTQTAIEVQWARFDSFQALDALRLEGFSSATGWGVKLNIRNTAAGSADLVLSPGEVRAVDASGAKYGLQSSVSLARLNAARHVLDRVPPGSKITGQATLKIGPGGRVASVSSTYGIAGAVVVRLTQVDDIESVEYLEKDSVTGSLRFGKKVQISIPKGNSLPVLLVFDAPKTAKLTRIEWPGVQSLNVH